jgi:hypothetical protein
MGVVLGIALVLQTILIKVWAFHFVGLTALLRRERVAML